MSSTKANAGASTGNGAAKPLLVPVADFTVAERAARGKAETYAGQNERDHAALKAAVASGRIEAQPGL